MKKKNDIKRTLLVSSSLAILVLVLVMVALNYKISNFSREKIGISYQGNNTPTPTKGLIPGMIVFNEDEVQRDVENWVVYRNENNGFYVKYPSNVTVSENTPNDVIFTLQDEDGTLKNLKITKIDPEEVVKIGGEGENMIVEALVNGSKGYRKLHENSNYYDLYITNNKGDLAVRIEADSLEIENVTNEFLQVISTFNFIS